MTRYRKSHGILNSVNVECVDIPSHTSTLLQGLSIMRSKNLLMDITLSAQGENFQAHRLLLAASSDYFRAMFTDEMKERSQNYIELLGVSSIGLQTVLTYIYTGVLSLDLSTVQDVLSAADHLQLPAVQQACAVYLQKQLDLENCVDVASIAEMYSLTSLCTKAFAIMCSNLREFSNTSDFLRLTSSQLEQLLRSDHPVNCSEGEVASAVAAWLSHSSCRLRDAHLLLYYINWAEVPGQILHSLALPCPLPISNMSVAPSPPKGLVNSRGLELAFVKVGGFSISGITNEITFRLNSNRKWQHLTTIPHVEQCNFGAAVMDNKLYVVGGCFNQSLQENIHPFGFCYNPLTDKWITISPMLRERCRFTLTALDDKLYAVGGALEDTALADIECEVYSPVDDSWRNIGGLPSRAQHTAAALNHQLYVFGGIDLPVDSVLDTCYTLDIEFQSWHRVADMLFPRADHTAFAYKDKIYICGGWNEDNASNSRQLVSSIDCYDPSSDTWSVVTHLPTPRYHAGIAVLEEKLYVMGGFLSDVTFDKATGIIECFDLVKGEWHTDQSYPKDIWEHTCVALHVPRRRENMDVMLNIDT